MQCNGTEKRVVIVLHLIRSGHAGTIVGGFLGGVSSIPTIFIHGWRPTFGLKPNKQRLKTAEAK